MDSTLAGLIRLRQFPTGRRLFVFYRVLEVANTLNAISIANLAQTAIASDVVTIKLEQRWTQKRRAGKTSAKQIKAQKALQLLDIRVDRAITGLRDGAEAIIRGAGRTCGQLQVQQAGNQQRDERQQQVGEVFSGPDPGRQLGDENGEEQGARRGDQQASHVGIR
jgi:hypothetical protein